MQPVFVIYLGRKFSFVLFFVLIAYINGLGQISVPGIPESFTLKTKSVPEIPVKQLEKIDTAGLRAFDVANGIPNRYGVVEQMYVDIKKDGIKTHIEGRGDIWRYKIKSPVTFSLGIYFTRFLLPPEASVFIYNEDHTSVMGAFTDMNENSDQVLAIGEFKGKTVIVEYFEPVDPQFEGELVIGSVSQAYNDIRSTLATRVGINCSEGANWQDHKHAICKMTFNDGLYAYTCTGFLVNNTRRDAIPYFMTANHCISTSSEARTLVTYFNFENSTCTSSDASAGQTLSGSTLKSTSQYSDFSLLLLNQYPPASYKPFYAGWDATGSAPTSGVCIHHPQGTPKCIAIDNNAPVSYAHVINWDNTYNSSPNTHWQTYFDVGNTESGSSGSPLFDQNKRVVGQLHGGGDLDSYYGKFSLSWNYNSSSSAQLKYWLDPDVTGTLVMDGEYLIAKPKSAFSTAITSVCLDAPVQLTDKSQYVPSQWKWTISPSSYEFTQGTSSTSKNPVVLFKSDGIYSVSLYVANSNGADSLTKSNYISVNDFINVKMSGITADSLICGCNLSKFPIVLTGAPDYTYSIERTDKISYFTSNDTLYLSLVNGALQKGSFDTHINLKGTFGSCVASDSALLKIRMPVNDDVANAYQLFPGNNGSYSNLCGTTQANEPSPPTGDCTSSVSWCSNVQSTNKINNTIWFTFVGPSTGKITIDTHNYNDKIAVYDADSPDDLLSGNFGKYKLIAANDNRSASDSSALLENISVEPGKIYWLQVDGNQGNTGTCSIDLICNSLEVMPNPSNGIFDVIISNENAGTATVKIYSLTGNLLFSNDYLISNDSNRISFNLSNIPSGLYNMRVMINNRTMNTKILIVK